MPAGKVDGGLIDSEMGTENHIVIDPKICHGKPIIRGTRLPVAIVLVPMLTIKSCPPVSTWTNH